MKGKKKGGGERRRRQTEVGSEREEKNKKKKKKDERILDRGERIRKKNRGLKRRIPREGEGEKKLG